MNESQALLKSYLLGACELSGAQSGVLYIPGPGGATHHAMLLFSGTNRTIPELKDIETANAFAQKPIAKMKLLQTPKEALAAGATSPLIASSNRYAVIIPLYEEYLHHSAVQTRENPRRRSADDSAPQIRNDLPAAWLAMDFAKKSPTQSGGPTNFLGWFLGLMDFSEERDGPYGLSSSFWTWFLGLGGAIGHYLSHISSVLHDSLTGLPGPPELHQRITVEQVRATHGPRKSSLVLISALNIDAINEAHDRDIGDFVLKEFAQRIRMNIRATDFLGRYGGSVFALIFYNASEEEAVASIKRIIKNVSASPYSAKSIAIQAAVGIANCARDPKTQSQLILQRAAQALQVAKDSASNDPVVWRADEVVVASEVDPLTGIVTGNMARDYRRMALMWETVSTIAEHNKGSEILSRIVEGIYSAFRPNRIAVFLLQTNGELKHEKLLFGHDTSHHIGDPQTLSSAELAMVQQSHDERQVYAETISGISSCRPPLNHPALALPLLVGDDSMGCLFLDRESGVMGIDISDVLFLQGLAGQLAMAIHRSQLSQQETQRLEDKRRKLNEEFTSLRLALGQAKLIHCSPAMEQILSTTRRAAKTDATILVGGESGSGKGILAQTIHNLSARKNKPFVTVDCSAIAPSLIDNELFGHVRGAYTGAGGQAGGRIAEAHGGTIFLDEIAELPLEVQGRLLTFVQEKTITPVGSSRTRLVDVRIVAASHHDLEADVAAGRFRQDLFFRLNVIRLELPPLRDRPEEIPVLARYFLDHSATQYQKQIDSFSTEAEQALLAYYWPGNVRELQNKIMRAVILCESDELGTEELGLTSEGLPQRIPPTKKRHEFAQSNREPFSQPSGPQPPAPKQSTSSLLERLKICLGNQVEHALGDSSSLPPPLYRWLEDDLIDAAHRISASLARTRSGSVTRRAATLVGIPESTYRRKLRSVQTQAKGGAPWREADWSQIPPILDDLIVNNEDRQSNLVKELRSLLLVEITNRNPPQVRIGAAMMDSTEPTYRRWCCDL